ncbi:MAG: LacI family DNA-binding transcriptional regulator [Rhodobacteraceae bacterium]|nr:LacI family DNA-binding transcriptional regulator [Paracoccaceae bacterium]
MSAPSQKVTSAEVALRAGVSRSAVSRVFTPGASASKETIRKVRTAAEELGYRPNILARAMVSGKSRIIGLVVAYLNNQFYPEILEKLSNALRERGYHVLVFMTSRTEGNIDAVVDEILDYQVDGIIAASVALSSDLSARCEAAGVPVVLFNRTQDGDALSDVTTDNYGGGRTVAEFLLAGGHHKIGYIAGWEGASTQRDREAGFLDALAAAGMRLHAREVGNFVMEEAKSATLRMFSNDPPDAVFVANDHMAIAVMDTLRHDLQLRIPDDVSVVSYDDVSAASWPAYDLTTVRQPANQMVRETIDLLLGKIDDPDSPQRRIKIEGQLIVRGSARVPEGWR